MPSWSLKLWRKESLGRLDEIEAAHASVGGIARGRRYATQQINFAYVVLLSSEFQKFCRDLHSESVDELIASVSPAIMRTVFREAFLRDRYLDRGNPNAGNIGSDFNRLGVQFWKDVQSASRHNPGRKEYLDELNRWRNAISHQDFTPVKLASGTLYAFSASLVIARVRQWRSACEQLAEGFDQVMTDHIESVTGTRPC